MFGNIARPKLLVGVKVYQRSIFKNVVRNPAESTVVVRPTLWPSLPPRPRQLPALIIVKTELGRVAILVLPVTDSDSAKVSGAAKAKPTARFAIPPGV
jgi:hypothetical protein